MHGERSRPSPYRGGVYTWNFLGGQGYTGVTIQANGSYTFGDGVDYNAYIFKHVIGQGGSFIVNNTYNEVYHSGPLPGEITLGKDGNSRYFKITNIFSSPVTLYYKKL